MSHRLPLLLIVFAALLVAAAPIATITSSEAVTLNGVSLSAAKVPSTPLVSGDSIATTKAPAVVVFTDKSRVVLEKNSRVKLDSDGDNVLVRLLEGALAYKLVPNSGLQFVALGQPVKNLTSPEGAFAIRGNQLVTGPGAVSSIVSSMNSNPAPPPTSPFR